MKNLIILIFLIFSYPGFSQILPSMHGVHDKKGLGGGSGSGTRNFTNCSKTGREGPSQSDCNTAYASDDLNGEVTVTNGIQEWTVPTTGSYVIEVWGARGGGIGYTCSYSSDVSIGSTGCLGANGARMKGTFNLTQGDILRIAVGQMGEDYSNRGGGGGGGSFVAKGVNHAGATPLIIAGGGGGGHYVTKRAVIPGQITESALANTSNWSSGTNYGPGGGGSWSGDGADGTVDATSSYSDPGGGKGWGNYLVGGVHAGGNPHWALGDGGFGGGGGGSWGGGPGGGYNGGPAVAANGLGDTSGGSGAGSYNSGSSQDNTAGAWNSHGKVTVTW